MTNKQLESFEMNSWLNRRLESLKFWSQLFNKALKENNNNGAFEASTKISELKKSIKEFTGWSEFELLSKY